MSDSPLTPRMQRGALVGLAAVAGARPRLIAAFQYNPETVTRSLQPLGTGEGGDRIEAQRLQGAPVETLKLDVELDATDARASGEATAVGLGLYPQLSALELLVYPSSEQVERNAALVRAGSLEVVPPAGPLTLLYWGARRVLPVKVTELSITEEAFDTELNPIRARVSLGLRVLSYNDLPLGHPARALFLSHQQRKEELAGLAGSRGFSGVIPW